MPGWQPGARRYPRAGRVAFGLDWSGDRFAPRLPRRVSPGHRDARTGHSGNGQQHCGRRGGVFTALGVSCGQAVWTLTASAGISAVLVACRPAFLTLKYIGAAYLLYLGLHAIWSATRRQADPPAAGGGPARRGALACY